MTYVKYEGFFNGKPIDFLIENSHGLNDYQIRLVLSGKYGDELVLNPEEPKLIVVEKL